VVTGTLNSGIVTKGDKLMIGPFYGTFYEIQIKSIHNNFKTHIEYLEAGQSGCFNIKSIEKKFTLKRDKIRKGMVLLNKENSQHTYRVFEAKIKILHHPSTISPNYESIIHCGSIRQVATLIHIQKDLLRTGDQSIVKFRFKLRPEFIQKNKQIIFREGKTKGVGVVTKLLE
jgi:GTPase